MWRYCYRSCRPKLGGQVSSLGWTSTRELKEGERGIIYSLRSSSNILRSVRTFMLYFMGCMFVIDLVADLIKELYSRTYEVYLYVH